MSRIDELAHSNEPAINFPSTFKHKELWTISQKGIYSFDASYRFKPKNQKKKKQPSAQEKVVFSAFYCSADN